MATVSARDVIRELNLSPHPEGGYYREVFRSPHRVQSHSHDGPRSASTQIYYLLESGSFSAFHRVSSDETWHHYLGDAVELCVLREAGVERLRLGSALALGERPQHVIPAGEWQAARVTASAHGFALCGCSVAPGFEFSDFEMPTRSDLLRLFPEQRFPEHQELILALTRPSGPPTTSEGTS
ncbi:MAG TPA: cupin domain-containing protein [Polyangiaceae bacterium]|nr:cupin domain-containing protein [Polyangiaceae bacterium]